MSNKPCLSPNALLSEISTGIAGSHFYSNTVHSPLRVGDSLKLIRDPENPHGRNAIRIERASGEILGFVPSELAATLAQEIDSGINAYAFLSNHFYGSWTVTIILSDLHSDALQGLIEKKRALAIIQTRLEWALRRAAERGQADAEGVGHSSDDHLREVQFVFGLWFLEVPSRFADAVHFIGYAAMNGHQQANELVRKLFEQDGAGEWIYSFAQAGHAEAQYQVAHEYFGRKRPDCR